MLPKFNRCFATPGSVLNVKALVGAFNKEKARIGAFSVIVKLCNDSFQAQVVTQWRGRQLAMLRS